MFPIALVGTNEALIVIGVIVLVFGAKKLPELGRSLAQGIHEFKKASKEIANDEDPEENNKDKKD